MDQILTIGARRILASKLALQKGLPDNYVHDPAVAMLLSLFIDQADGISSTDRGLHAVVGYVPETIVSRWIAVLVGDGLIRITDTEQGARPISLTERGATIVRATVIAVGKAEKHVRDDAASRMVGDAEGADRRTA